MEVLVGYVLLVGVVTSVLLIIAGLVWRFVATGSLTVEYTLAGTNLAQLFATELRLALTGDLRPRRLVDLGVAVLLLTPYARVLASVAFFAFGERNAKYTVITAVVLVILTYSLFVH
jgi:uncharacterized membrane protein